MLIVKTFISISWLSTSSPPFTISLTPWVRGYLKPSRVTVVRPPLPCGSWRPVHRGHCLPRLPAAGALGSAGREWCGNATSPPQSAAATGSKVSPSWSASLCQQVLPAGCWTSPWGTGWSTWGCRSTRANFSWMVSTTCTTWWAPHFCYVMPRLTWMLLAVVSTCFLNVFLHFSDLFSLVFLRLNSCLCLCALIQLTSPSISEMIPLALSEVQLAEIL